MTPIYRHIYILYDFNQNRNCIMSSIRVCVNHYPIAISNIIISVFGFVDITMITFGCTVHVSCRRSQCVSIKKCEIQCER